MKRSKYIVQTNRASGLLSKRQDHPQYSNSPSLQEGFRSDFKKQQLADFSQNSFSGYQDYLSRF
jgi:hypothetical protein